MESVGGKKGACVRTNCERGRESVREPKVEGRGGSKGFVTENVGM